MKKRILSLFIIFFIFTSCNGKEDKKSNEIIEENKIILKEVDGNIIKEYEI